MSKRLFCLLLTVVLTVLSLPVLAETGNWVAASDDESLEVHFVSLKESDTYPIYNLNLRFRLNQVVLSEVFSWKWDLSELLGEYITENPPQNNRKIKATCSGEIIEFIPLSDTTYRISTSCKIGDKEKTIYGEIDLARLFPDDFVNYDALFAANCLKAFAQYVTINSFSNCRMKKVTEYKDIISYKFQINYRETLWANYTISDGSIMFYYDLKTAHIGTNYMDSFTPYDNIPDDEATLILNSSIELYY